VEFQLVSLLADGTRESEFSPSGETLTIGRKGTDVECPEDVYMADHHATIVRRDGRYLLEDKAGSSGVWLRVAGAEARPLQDGDSIWLGSQLLLLARVKDGWTLDHYDADGVLKARHPVGEQGVVVGKKSATPLDVNDASLSRRHAGFRLEGGRVVVGDLGSTNGTWVKLTAPTPLRDGDEFRLGSKRFRAEIFAAVAKLGAGEIVVDKKIEEPIVAAAGAPLAAVAEGLLAVTIEHPQHPASFGVAPAQDVLHGFFDYLKARHPDCKLNKKGVPQEHNEEPLDWQCLSATCGLCAVQIIDGAENFLPPDPGSPEMKTLEFPRGLEANPSRYRLACVAKVRGPVKLSIPE
jgi:pSer/pThr/pTyr-binding forkhead associated (FHA) protein/ferredoxin